MTSKVSWIIQKRQEDYRFEIHLVQVALSHSFLNLLACSVNMSLIVAIDFTGSNGHPLHPQNLHYLSPQCSQYQQTIRTLAILCLDMTPINTLLCVDLLSGKKKKSCLDYH
ncbi:hypothetical protein RFI_09355 [Reticulomyxa filosa]|uniref:Copine C-terminal domain-containing protein n=1 Tax=Reticulomyxa filosa TaxID=46433 RepID=X6NPC3_RETFI|nr:hypothetical protein RFI_09355 [Reticulomyxa filosa]|eukprot:ETO27778.1 hypothetical protein RFI_09355 [Reticulomyxa filosa]